MVTIDRDIARRFVLGKQGLWPGRRQRGSAGVTQALQEMAYLQLDPLQIIARSHDIQLHSRVLDYTPGLWEDVAYGQRAFFDWGGWLAIRPMSELPFWRTVMQRERDGDIDCDARIHQNGRKYAAAIAEMRAILTDRTHVTNRDFTMAERTHTDSYRGLKDSALALYYLWRTGEIMTHHRENFERVYALTAHVAPDHLIDERDAAAVDRFLFRKEIGFFGLSRLQRTSDAFQRGVPFSRKAQIVKALLEAGDIVEVQVAGWRATHYALADDVPLLTDLSAGRIPTAWAPLDTTTTDEAVFLAPLDPVSARGRAKELFDFNYVWEVYKPAAKRTYGYYTLPVLWGDRLVARFDAKFDRTVAVLNILGFWLEDSALGQDEAFAAALARGFRRFARFLGARAVDAAAVSAPLLRSRVQALAPQP